MSHVRPPRIKLTKHTYSQLKTALRNAPTPSDRSEHNLTEIALRESEAFYRQMFESNRAVKLVVDPVTTQIIQANQAACNFYGYSHEQMTSLRITDISVISKAELAAHIQRTLLDKGKTLEARHRLASGEIRDVEIFSGSLEVNDRHYLYAIIQDITEHKQAEKALLKSEELHRLVIQHMPDSSVFMFDNDMRYLIADGPFLKRFGSIYDNIVGKTIQETLPQAALDFLVPIHQRALNGESFTYERVLPDYAYQAYVIPVRDDTGQIIGGLILSQDITERKQAEKALRESEKLHHLFTKHMPNTSVVMYDTELRYTFAEGPYLKRFGAIWDNAVGKTPQDMYSTEALNYLLPIYKRPLQGETFTFERVTENYAYEAYAAPVRDEHEQIIGGIVLSHDITQRRQAQEALRESEARFHSLVDLAPVGIIQTDLQGSRVFCNNRWCEMTGITLEQALGDIYYETIYPPDLNIASSAWEKMMESNLPFDNCVFRYQRPDKSTVWVSGNGRPLYDAQGNIAGYIGSVTDITERKQLEDALITSENRFRTLIDVAPVGIVETDAHGEIILGNTQWHTLSDIPDTEAFMDNGSQTIHPDDLSKIQAANQSMVENADSVDNLEYRFMHHDGKIVWVSDSSRPLFDPDGAITGFIVTMTDITERKRLEEELRKNEERLRVITDNIQDLITQNDTKGNLTFVSQSSRNMLGYEPESLLKMSSIELVHPEDRLLMTQVLQKAIETGTEYLTVESRLRHADGHYISAESIIKFVRDVESNITGAVFISRDVSERNRMQSLLLEKEKLQTALDKELELNNLKTRMMNRIAHEFRTPLTVIQASTETLTHYFDRLTVAQKDSKEVVIKSQIQRLTDMLDEISLVMNGSFTPEHVHRTTTDLGLLCQQIAAHLEQQFTQPGKFVLDIPEKATALVDAQVLRNAILHIMRNAARFSKPSGIVKVSLSSDENNIQLRITDTGIGILPEELPRIFEPFFRGTNISEISGLGIGLTIARAAVEAHDGTISVESVVREGTTVTINIPV